ncbi:MAG: metallophosphoesterase [Thermoplasmatota archaeon]
MAFENPKKIKRKLTRVRSRLSKKKMDLQDMKWVILSDVHKGNGDSADDFKKCEKNYLSALSYYYKHDYTLVLLGDIEELWENRIKGVLDRHKETFKWERKFFNNRKNNKVRYYRIFGNHDDLWDKPSSVVKHLSKVIGPIEVLEGMRLKIVHKKKEIGEIFLTHGHQGTFSSDTMEKISRILVRYLWRPVQRTIRYRPNTLSTKYKAKSEHEDAMHQWADDISGLVLIAGHTHHPVFMAESHEYTLKEQIKGLEAKKKKKKGKGLKKIDKEIAKLRKKLVEKTEENQNHLYLRAKGSKPSYFNTGCCIFKDGDITAIEIGQNEEGKEFPEIRLVKWDNETSDMNKKRIILRSADLLDVFKQCS